MFHSPPTSPSFFFFLSFAPYIVWFMLWVTSRWRVQGYCCAVFYFKPTFAFDNTPSSSNSLKRPSPSVWVCVYVVGNQTNCLTQVFSTFSLNQESPSLHIVCHLYVVLGSVVLSSLSYLFFLLCFVVGTSCSFLENSELSFSYPVCTFQPKEKKTLLLPSYTVGLNILFFIWFLPLFYYLM